MGIVGTLTFGLVGNLSLSLFGHCTMGTPVRANLGSLLASSSSKILHFLLLWSCSGSWVKFPQRLCFVFCAEVVRKELAFLLLGKS